MDIVTAAQKQTYCNLYIRFYIVRERLYVCFRISFVLRCSNPGGAVMFPVSALARTKFVCARIAEVRNLLKKKQIYSLLVCDSSYLWIKKFRMALCNASFGIYKPLRKTIIIHTTNRVCILKAIYSSSLDSFIFSSFFLPYLHLFSFPLLFLFSLFLFLEGRN
jgi:hypothetical protein